MSFKEFKVSKDVEATITGILFLVLLVFLSVYLVRFVNAVVVISEDIHQLNESLIKPMERLNDIIYLESVRKIRRGNGENKDSN